MTEKKRYRAGLALPFEEDIEERIQSIGLPETGLQVFINGNSEMGAMAMATCHIREYGFGSATWLPSGVNPWRFDWPDMRHHERDPRRAEVVIWAHGFSTLDEQRYGNALLCRGVRVVDVVAGPSGPLRFHASAMDELQRELNRVDQAMGRARSKANSTCLDAVVCAAIVRDRTQRSARHRAAIKARELRAVPNSSLTKSKQ